MKVKTRSAVLSEFKQLCEAKYTGTTAEKYCFYVNLFLRFSVHAPTRVTNEDFLDFNLDIRHRSVSYRNGAMSAVKAYFELYLRKKVKNFALIRPKNEIRAPVTYDAELFYSKIKGIENIKHRCILSIALSSWLRVGEIVSLKPEHIDSHRMVIRVVQSKGAQDRLVKLSKEVLYWLRQYYREYRPTDYLFMGQGNKGPYSA